MNERLYAMALFYLTNTVYHFLSAHLLFIRCLLNDSTTRALECCRWQTALVAHNYSPVQFMRKAVLTVLNIRNMYNMTGSSIKRDYHTTVLVKCVKTMKLCSLNNFPVIIVRNMNW